MERPNLILENTSLTFQYKSPNPGGGRKSAGIERNRAEHSQRILAELDSAYLREKELREKGLITRSGTYLDFSGPPDGSLEALKLENQQQGVRLLNVRKDDETDRATVFVPAKKDDFYQRKARDYADPSKNTKKGNPKNNVLLTSIEDVGLAEGVPSFWTGSLDRRPGQSRQWIEIWLDCDNAAAEQVTVEFKKLLDEEGIAHSPQTVVFPSRIVLLARANEDDLQALIRKSDSIAEMREAIQGAEFFERLDAKEQAEWMEDLVSRTERQFGRSVVCILDSGVNVGHPLLRDAFEDATVDTVNPAWGLADNIDHGTGLAGIALYDDLAYKLASSESVTITHRLESVKIYEGNQPSDPDLFGAIAQQGVDLAIIGRDEANRIFCSSVTAAEDENADGAPTSWSAAVDAAISHPDNQGEEHELFLVSAGNVPTQRLSAVRYPDANRITPVRSPGQAWNALTVGAYSEAVFPSGDSEEALGYEIVAEHGALSPFSSTSLPWKRTALVKPEILCDGGNAVREGEKLVWESEELSPLSTSNDVIGHPLRHFNGTSAAVAKAAWMAAEIENAYPNLWPETVRGLMVHSARWSDAMVREFCPPGSDRDKPTAGRYELLHACGYGIPDLSRAIECAGNSVNLIIQDELTPFQCVKRDGRNVYGMRDMHLHHLPWPSEVLRDLGDAEARLRVTLSYYIEPNPGLGDLGDRYRYASHGLRFDVNNPGESEYDFLSRVDVNMRADNDSKGTKTSKDWYLGTKNRRIGSIFSDFKETTAVDLSDVEYVAVYPVIGWWRTRHSERKYDSKARYSLIVSIETPKVNADLYTAISQKISMATPIEVTVPSSAY